MKIRTDFVTNSSSSSFVAMSIKTKGGETFNLTHEDCSWSASDIFQLTNENGKIMWYEKDVNSVLDLIKGLLCNS